MLRTSRLVLRGWRPTDRAAVAMLNADRRVMAYFPRLLAPAEIDELVERIERHFRDHGFGLWVVEVPGVAPFVGFTGLSIPRFTAHFTPCVEVGWRLAAEYWGKGYAAEAARAAVAFGFEHVGLSEIVSFTVVQNRRSRRVMEKLGMVHDPADDFDHPGVPASLRRHVLYRLAGGAHRTSAGSASCPRPPASADDPWPGRRASTARSAVSKPAASRTHVLPAPDEPRASARD